MQFYGFRLAAISYKFITIKVLSFNKVLPKKHFKVKKKEKKRK